MGKKDIGSILLVLFLMGVGVTLGGKYVGERMRKQAIQHNCAQYDSQTGEFMWKEVGE